MTEHSWHSSQQVNERPGTDGEEAEVTSKVAIAPELEQWALSRGSRAQVLEPEVLWDEIWRTATAMAEEYRKDKRFSQIRAGKGAPPLR